MKKITEKTCKKQNKEKKLLIFSIILIYFTLFFEKKQVICYNNFMLAKISPSLKRLASKFDKPLYIVGGYVRGMLIDGVPSHDVDLAGPITSGEFLRALSETGFNVRAESHRTHTVMFTDDNGAKYEFTSFRKEVYPEGGGHSPEFTEFTEDIREDALRRDFKCNAVYYDIKNGEIVDPLKGVWDIKYKILDTVKEPAKVFESDGLRLLRLARFSAELDFTPTEDVIKAATLYADNIKDISGERIYDELCRMLVSDTRFPYSDKAGHYHSLKMCQKIGVLKYIFPEISLGEGLPQRKDFHKYDVLEHSFRALLYSDPSVRLAALLHDVGKSVVYLRDGMYHFHAKEGVRVARERLSALKAPKRVIEDTCWLILWHMYDLKVDEPDHDVKRFIASNYEKIDRLLLLKEADIKASSVDLVPLTVVRWKKLIAEMQQSLTPLALKELAVDGEDLEKLGLRGRLVGVTLKRLFEMTLDDPSLNKKETLIEIVKNFEDDFA